jgi:hypothetical protein
MISEIYKLTIIPICLYLIYLLKYVNRGHIREKARRVGLLLNNKIKKIISTQTYEKIRKYMYNYFFGQLLVLLETAIGFFEGINDIDPIINLIEHTDISIQTDEILPVIIEKEVIKEVYHPFDTNSIVTKIIEYMDNKSDVVTTEIPINTETIITEKIIQEDKLKIEIKDKVPLPTYTEEIKPDIYEKYKTRDGMKIIKATKKTKEIIEKDNISPFIKKNSKKEKDNTINGIIEDDGSVISLTSLTSMGTKIKAIKKKENKKSNINDDTISIKRKTREKIKEKKAKVNL